MENKNKEKVLTIIGVVTLLLFGVGATFAYFVAQGGSSEQTNINVTTHTTDSLVFEVGESISITADQTTFAPGAGNRSDNTFARATLKANSSTNSATANYYVYLNIDINEFKYTTEEKIAELILTVNYKDTNGNITPVTSINGLNYVTVGEVSGFDITEANNLITIANNHEINSTGTEVDEWDITLTLVNLESNQNANAGKTFNATLMIQKEKYKVTLANHIIGLYTTQGANNLYHHDGTILATEVNTKTKVEIGDILDANDNSYRYSGANYVVTAKYKTEFNNVNNVNSDANGVIGMYCGDDYSYVGLGCYYPNTSSYYLAYDSTKTQYVTYKEAALKAVEDGYLEESVKNYVCFGTDSETCDAEHLYRIIGVFDSVIVDDAGNATTETEQRVKLIKAYEGTETSLGSMGSNGSNFYWWSGSSKNESDIWTNSTLNTDILNGTYLTTLGTEWTNKIAMNEYKIGGINWLNSINNVKKAYQNEILNPYFGTENGFNGVYTTISKIGLIYINDYGYSASYENWTKNLSNEGYADDIVKNNNWMYSGKRIWTITRSVEYPKEAHGIDTDGSVGYFYVMGEYCTILPTFYLKSSVTFAGGTGTEADPYRIA